MDSLPIDTAKRLLLQGKAYAVPQWAKENNIPHAEKLIDAAAKELTEEAKKLRGSGEALERK